MFCIGCGVSLIQNVKKRVNLGPDSAGALEPRERVTALWLSLVRKKLLLQGVTIEEININESDPGKMCRVYFGQRLHKLQSQVEDKLTVVLTKIAQHSTTSSQTQHSTTSSQAQQSTTSSQAQHSTTSLQAQQHSTTSSQAQHSTTSLQAQHYTTSSQTQQSTTSTQALQSTTSLRAEHSITSSQAQHSITSSQAHHSITSSQAQHSRGGSRGGQLPMLVLAFY